MNILQKHSIFLSLSFIFFSFPFIFSHVLSFSFMFCHVLSCSFHVLSCSLIFPLIFCHFLSLFFPFFFFLFFFSSGAQIPFLPRLPHDFLLKLLCIKSILGAVSGGYPNWALFFSLVYKNVFSFSFSISFDVFSFFLCFSFFFIVYSCIFLLFSLKKNLPFSFCFSFFFSRVLKKLWRHTKIPWGKVHILSWLYLLCTGSSSLFPVE